ncbi:restriction endonuclease subunit S [Psychrobacter faecalis]|uniref:restriction endonuclease subunit S n=1 Tax=Psychrobacter faecalis TaxID=180588 RepID=UPI003FD5E75A
MINEEALEVSLNWIDVQLAEISEVVTGNTPSTKDKENYGSYLPFIKPPQLLNSVISDSDVSLSEKGIKTARVLPENSILVSCIGNLGKTAINKVEVASNQQINAIVPSTKLNPKFIFYQTQSTKFLHQLEENSSATTIPIVNKSKFEKLEISLCPINEQNRIVDKIETLFSEVDAGIENLTLAKRQLEQYRQSLLKHAFEGKLTAKWREEYAEKHGKSLPNVDELLEQIQTARQDYYDQQMADWEQAVEAWEEEDKEGKKPRKPNALKKLESIADLNEINLPKLPSSWLWERLGLMTLSVEYGTSTKSEKQGLVPVLRMGNMQNGIIDWDDLVFTSDTDEIEKYALKKGDVLFNRTNSPELVGKTSIILSDTKAIFAGYLIRVNQLDSIVYSKYLNYFLGSHIAKQYGNFVKTDGVNQSNINGQKLMNYPFPYCSLDEQVLIVAELDKKIGTADKFKEEIESTIKKLVNLKTSILHKAFQGKLVPQDPNDPPASELLAQIKAEREAKALAEKQAKQDKATSKSKEKIKSAKTPKKSKKDEQITLPL